MNNSTRSLSRSTILRRSSTALAAFGATAFLASAPARAGGTCLDGDGDGFCDVVFEGRVEASYRLTAPDGHVTTTVLPTGTIPTLKSTFDAVWDESSPQACGELSAKAKVTHYCRPQRGSLQVRSDGTNALTLRYAAGLAFSLDVAAGPFDDATIEGTTVIVIEQRLQFADAVYADDRGDGHYPPPVSMSPTTYHLTRSHVTAGFPINVLVGRAKIEAGLDATSGTLPQPAALQSVGDLLRATAAALPRLGDGANTELRLEVGVDPVTVDPLRITFARDAGPFTPAGCRLVRSACYKQLVFACDVLPAGAYVTGGQRGTACGPSAALGKNEVCAVAETTDAATFQVCARSEFGAGCSPGIVARGSSASCGPKPPPTCPAGYYRCDDLTCVRRASQCDFLP